MSGSSKKIDSNCVGLMYAEETSLGVLPDDPGGSVGDQAGGTWRPLDPNEYSDFGADIKMTARAPINESRQRRKGVVTGLDASGGFQQDLTQSNLTRLMQGFFFADAHERAGNLPLSENAAITGAVVDIETLGVINVAAGKGALFTVGMLIKTSGFVNSANNIQVARITAISVDELTLSVTTTVVEAYSVGKLEVVGFQHVASDLAITLTSNTLTLTSTVGFAAQSYQVGEWIFIGGDSAATAFSLGGSGENKPGYARIETVGANALTLKEPTFTPLTNTGTGKTIQIYTGAYIRNEKTPSLIKRRSYQIERTLGSDANGVQSEVLVGSVPNQFSMKLPSEDKIVCDLSFIGTDVELRDGTAGVKPGDRTETLSAEDAYNTTNDVYQQRLFVHSDTPTPTSLFAFVTDASIAINNNASGLKAISVLGSFEIGLGDFEVSGSLEVVFLTVAAVNSVRNNADVGFNTIMARENTGMVYDIPLLSLGGGRVNVEKDEPIMLPLDKQAAENENGYTMSATYFSYLPTVAMPG